MMENMQFVRSMVRLCLDGWDMGWHERNAGNVSYRLTNEEKSQLLGTGSHVEGQESLWFDLGEEHPVLEGECLAVTASGSLFRYADRNPESSIGVVEFGERGRMYRVVAGFADGARPTSELPAHAAAHEVLLSCGTEKRVLYHAHTPSATGVTNVLELRSSVMTKALWSVMIECMMFFPQGIGVVPQMVPGTKGLAKETAKLLKDHDAVLWSHHGMICPGVTFDDAFGLMHVIEKAAKIWLSAAAAAGSGDAIKGVSDDMLKEIAASYQLNVHESYLFETE